MSPLNLAPHENQSVIQAIISTMPAMDKINTTFDLHNYEACNRIFREEKMELTGGDKVTDKIELGTDGTANRVKSYDEVPIKAEDKIVDMTMTLCGYNDNYVMEAEEIDANTESEMCKKIIDIVKLRELQPIRNICATIEADTYGVPDSAADDRKMYGFPYWASMADVGVTEPGFNGKSVVFGDGSSSTVIGGIDTQTYKQWRNYAHPYTSIDGTFLTAMSRTWHRLRFRPPINLEQLVRMPFYNFKIDMGLENILALEDIARAGGDAFGKVFDTQLTGQLMYRRIPINHADHLDDHANGLIIWRNLAHFEGWVRRGWWFKRVAAGAETRRPHVQVQHIDCRANLRCRNRKLGVATMHKVRAA